MVARRYGETFPWVTLLVNSTGCWMIGFYAALASPDGRLAGGARMHHFVMSGVCGGYTTFSIFSLATLHWSVRANRHWLDSAWHRPCSAGCWRSGWAIPWGNA